MSPSPLAATFAAAVTRIDGRIQRVVTDDLKARLGVDYVDIITEPGVDAALSEPGELTVLGQRLACRESR